jgi:predicted 2-oxoglutarate/Fe(II)-dependent dioxygenase YbiX
MKERYCRALAEVLDVRTCREWIDRLENQGYQDMAGDYPPSYRDNDRQIVDDPELARRLFAKLAPALPRLLERQGFGWELVGLNSRFRSCRYQDGQSFTRHRDGAHSDGASRRSLLTLMLYLNGADEFHGGRTRFYADRWTPDVELSVDPEAGMGLVFEHEIWHDGEAVTRGSKYVLRTDVMYRCLGQPIDGHTGYVFDLVELSEGRLASASRDRTVRIWSQGKVDAVLRLHQGSVTCLARCGSRLWSGSRDRSIAIWNEDFSLRSHFKAHDGAVLALLPLRNGMIASSGAGGQIRIWDAEGSLRSEYTGGRWPWALCQLLTGELAVGDDDGQVRLLSPELGIRPWLQAPTGILCLLESDGAILAGGGDGSIRRWRHNGQTLPSWSGHRGPVTSLKRLPDARLLSGSEDDGVRIWDDGRSFELLRHQDFVRALCLVDGATALASGSYDGTVRRTCLRNLPRIDHLHDSVQQVVGDGQGQMVLGQLPGSLL